MAVLSACTVQIMVGARMRFLMTINLLKYHYYNCMYSSIVLMIVAIALLVSYGKLKVLLALLVM